MFTILIMAVTLQVHAYIKTINLCFLNMCNLLEVKHTTKKL